MSEPLGKGTLALLEELKKKYGPIFRAGAPKSRHKITQECADLMCIHLAEKMEVAPGGVWCIKRQWCSERDCPRERRECGG